MIVATGSETPPVVQPATGTTGSERPTALAFIDNSIIVPRRPPVLMQSRLGYAGGPIETCDAASPSQYAN